MNKVINTGWEYLRGDKMIWMIVIFLFIFSMLAVYSATGTLAYKMQVGNEKYLMKQIVKEIKPVFVTLIVEAYMVKLNIGEAFDDVAPSEHPNKVEVVMISFEGKGFQKQLMFEINRPKTGIPYLSDAEEVPSQGTMSGRFSGFFNDAENDDSDSFGDITNEI